MTGDKLLEVRAPQYVEPAELSLLQAHAVKALGQCEPRGTIAVAEHVPPLATAPVVDVDASLPLAHNEYVVFDVDQIRISYLLQVEFDGFRD